MKKVRDLSHVKSGGSRGFTLLELLITMGIAVMVLALGVPGLTKYVGKQQVHTDIDRLVASVRLARSEAMKRSGLVVVCPLSNREDTAPSCATNATANSWSEGWMVYISNGPTTTYNKATDPVLKVEQGGRNTKISSNGIVIPRIAFQSIGISTGTAGTFLVGDSKDQDNAKWLTLSRQGRARTNDYKDGPKVDEDD